MNQVVDIQVPFSDDVELSFVAENQTLPLVIEPKTNSLNLNSWAAENKAVLQELLNTYGGILFRGFSNVCKDSFQDFISAVSQEALEYKERSSPRSSVTGQIYTSTDHPNDKEIFLHTEQSYNKRFPNKIFFFCERPGDSGGNTPIADTRKIINRVPEDLKARFIEHGYRYARYFWPMMGMTWQHVFQTEDRAEVERYCTENDINFEWRGDDELKTYQVRPAIAVHPDTGEHCWFNHCTFFHVTSLDAETTEMLLASFDEEELPNNTYFGDGSKIDDATMQSLRKAYEDEKVEFPWQQGDILMLDNVMTAHGRGPYQGDRSILVGMSEPVAWQDVALKQTSHS